MSDRIAYGPHELQFGELTRATGRARPGTVMIVHGGFWRARHGLELGRPLAADLAAHGWTSWNIDYRRVGRDGGWPATFADAAAAIDRLAELDVDTAAVVTVGHSAGGQLAIWLAGRPQLPPEAPGAGPQVTPVAVVAQAGVLDLVGAARTGVGGTAVPDVLGGGPDDVPDRYRYTDPSALLPLPVPVLCVHARADDAVPFEQSAGYVTASVAAGGAAALAEVPGDHMSLIDPAGEGWAVVRRALPELVSCRLPG